jgi:hypothetical protein
MIETDQKPNPPKPLTLKSNKFFFLTVRFKENYQLFPIFPSPNSPSFPIQLNLQQKSLTTPFFRNKVERNFLSLFLTRSLKIFAALSAQMGVTNAGVRSQPTV